MITVLIEAITEAFVRAFGWIAGVARSVFAGQAADGSVAAAEGRVSRRRSRRSGRDKLRELAEPGDTEQLVRVYHQAQRNDNDRDVRIEALTEIADADPAAAEPLLREVLEGPDDPWVIMAALDTAGRKGMTGLLDVVEAAQDDPRPLVSEAAKPVHKRLRKAAGRVENPA